MHGCRKLSTPEEKAEAKSARVRAPFPGSPSRRTTGSFSCRNWQSPTASHRQSLHLGADGGGGVLNVALHAELQRRPFPPSGPGRLAAVNVCQGSVRFVALRARLLGRRRFRVSRDLRSGAQRSASLERVLAWGLRSRACSASWNRRMRSRMCGGVGAGRGNPPGCAISCSRLRRVAGRGQPLQLHTAHGRLLPTRRD